MNQRKNLERRARRAIPHNITVEIIVILDLLGRHPELGMIYIAEHTLCITGICRINCSFFLPSTKPFNTRTNNGPTKYSPTVQTQYLVRVVSAPLGQVRQMDH